MQLACWKLKEILAERDVSQTALGREYGVNQDLMSKYVRGIHRPPKALLKRIDADYAKLFGADAATANPLPARMTRRIRELMPDDQRLLFAAMAAILEHLP